MISHWWDFGGSVLNSVVTFFAGRVLSDVDSFWWTGLWRVLCGRTPIPAEVGSFCSRDMLGLQDWQGAFPPGLFLMKVFENQSFKLLFRCYDSKGLHLCLYWSWNSWLSDTLKPHVIAWYSRCEMLVYPYLSATVFSLIMIISMYVFLQLFNWMSSNGEQKMQTQELSRKGLCVAGQTLRFSYWLIRIYCLHLYSLPFFPFLY